MRPSARRLSSLLLAAGLGLGAAAADAAAQSLRGSPTAVDRVHRQALAHDLTFFRSGGSVRSAADEGSLVRLSGNDDYRVASVSYPYVLPATRTFVQRLGAQYRRACGERLVVTSAVRPRSMHLRNSHPQTVHPTGMAVDLRRPRKASCLRWLRRTLLEVERTGTIDATEEHRPPHFHVAVYPGPYGRYVARRTGGSVRVASAPDTYRVRRGDSLWGIARRHGTSVSALKAANGMRSDRILPGQRLVIPAR